MLKHKKIYNNQISVEGYLEDKVRANKKLEITRDIILKSNMYMKNLLSLAVMDNKLMDLSANDYIKNKTQIDKYMRKLFTQFTQITVQNDKHIKELKQI